MANMPIREVMTICTISRICASIRSIEGLSTKIYGIINAAMASRVAITPVLIGLPSRLRRLHKPPRHRRGDIRYDAEVENKHVRRQ